MSMPLSLTFILAGFIQLLQVNDLQEIRRLYSTAPLVKADARQLDKLLQNVDSSAAPLLCCYKGANEMIQAKYALNPFAKLQKFDRGKSRIQTAVSRDTLDLEMRFIRFSIQSNLPSFLGYNAEMNGDKQFITAHLGECRDADLKKTIINYLCSSVASTQEDLKQNIH